MTIEFEVSAKYSNEHLSLNPYSNGMTIELLLVGVLMYIWVKS